MGIFIKAQDRKITTMHIALNDHMSCIRCLFPR